MNTGGRHSDQHITLAHAGPSSSSASTIDRLRHQTGDIDFVLGQQAGVFGGLARQPGRYRPVHMRQRYHDIGDALGNDLPVAM